MNKWWWEAVHWCTLMVPYSRVHCYVGSQVSAEIKKREIQEKPGSILSEV